MLVVDFAGQFNLLLLIKKTLPDKIEICLMFTFCGIHLGPDFNTNVGL